MNRLKIESLTLGQVGTNCYLALNQETKELIIVDPADDAGRIERKITAMGGTPVAVLLTHGHFDHIGAAEALKQKYQIPVYAMEAEREVLASMQLNLSQMFGCPMTLEEADWLRDGQKLTLAGLAIAAYHTPGHTSGGACYYLPEEAVLFSGDTLFCESIGRTDFPTGSASALIRSVREKLFPLPEETLVLPGHNDSTTIAHEKQYNPYC